MMKKVRYLNLVIPLIIIQFICLILLFTTPITMYPITVWTLVIWIIFIFIMGVNIGMNFIEK